MPNSDQSNGFLDRQRFEPALRLLRQAHSYQSDTGHDVWDFAIEISQLKAQGLTRNDLRWLACKGLIEHRREITPAGDDERMFRKTGALTFDSRSCFILTEAGIQFTDNHITPADFKQNGEKKISAAPRSPVAREPSIPTWDCERHELRVGDQVVKRFKRPAVNQETILAAFQEEEWPPRIDDPLPMVAELDPKRRLHDAIKCLNRIQKSHLIQFEGDGTGEGILWRFVEHEREAQKKRDEAKRPTGRGPRSRPLSPNYP